MQLNMFKVTDFCTTVSLASYNEGCADGIRNTCDALRDLLMAHPDDFNLGNALVAVEKASEYSLEEVGQKDIKAEANNILNLINDMYTLIKDIHVNLAVEEGNYIPEELRIRVENIIAKLNEASNKGAEM